MNFVFHLVVHTANVLGIFNDPFEFAGDYGKEVNPVRQKVFDIVVSKEALANNSTDDQIKILLKNENADPYSIKEFRQILVNAAIEEDRNHGPLLSELITPELANVLIAKQNELQSGLFTTTELNDILAFVERHGKQKAFWFFRHTPPNLLNVDKGLKDMASREGRDFDLLILGSSQPLKGQTAHALKIQLLDQLLTHENFKATKAKDVTKKTLDKLAPQFLEHLLGAGAQNQELEVFCSPAGQLIFYWLYQSLNLHLIAEAHLIDQVNKVKEVFGATLGNPEIRAQAFADKLQAAGSGVVFTQESDTYVPQILLKDGKFLPIDKQNPADGTFVFLRSDLWEADYQIIVVEEYPGTDKGVLNVVLATSKQTGTKFLLAAAHGDSNKAEDGRLQIAYVMKKFKELQKTYSELQLLIGIDANTKNEADIEALHKHLGVLGLMGTSVGPTTVKQRMVTAQHHKAGRFAIDEEDYIITLKRENGGKYSLQHPTVGFSEAKPDETVVLPNVNNLSDHYPVGAELTE